MIRRGLTILLILLLSGACARRAVADEPIVLRDAAQHELRLPQRPERIITLLPSLTETVCALGQCGRLVATDRYSNWPDSVNRLPKVGGLDDAQIELETCVGGDHFHDVDHRPSQHIRFYVDEAERRPSGCRANHINCFRRRECGTWAFCAQDQASCPQQAPPRDPGLHFILS